jgi:hypothetical protein
MFFTVSVELPKGGFFEYSTESILQFLQAAKAFGNTDIEEVEDEDEDEDDDFEIPEEIAQHFTEGEEYVYKEDEDCYCWYDENQDAWYCLDVETGDWLLIENEA